MEAEARDPCNGKSCTMNEHCCNGHVCVDSDDGNACHDFLFPIHISNFDSLTAMGTGICLPVYGLRQGETCSRDTDCESGFVCTMSEAGGRTCQTPVPGDKGLGASKAGPAGR